MTMMHHTWWFLIAVALIILVAAWNVFRDDALHSRSQKLAMQRRLRRFEQEQRVGQQAAVMRRTREINALAHETCRTMLNAALEAQFEAEVEASKSPKYQHRCE